MTTIRRLPTVVGITGRAGAGKDSFASYLLEALFKKGKRVKIVRLADPLKEAYSALFVLKREDLEDFDFKNKVNEFTGNTHRQELQFLGTEAYRVRTGNPDVWVQVLRKNIDSLDVDVVIVPDVRFDNEAAFALSRGVLVKIVRPDNPETTSNHASEAGVSYDPDWVVDNDGTLEKLEGSAIFISERVN